MSGSTEDFYDGLAADYHLVYADWEATIGKQAGVLQALLEAAGVAPPARLLDAACGIGTQSLGLAARGYDVIGTDNSVASVQRAAAEAEQRGLPLETQVVDLRHLAAFNPGAIDAAICCDNALPHLLTDADLDLALTGFRAHLAPGSTFIASIRDYDQLVQKRPSGTPVVHRQEGDDSLSIHQVWTWSADTYEVAIHIERQGTAPRHDVYHTTYRALQRGQLTARLQATGFTARWLMPADSGYFQPLVVATAV